MQVGVNHGTHRALSQPAAVPAVRRAR
jgi:hypothetical protein